jgi:MATE family multidrug resistance protein
MISADGELRRLIALAVPIVITQVGTMGLVVVDTLMIGQVSVEALAAASLGATWTLGTSVVGMGLLYGLDPIITQAHGAGDGRRLGEALQRGLVLAVAVSAPLALVWWWTGAALRAFGQEPGLVALANEYVHAQIPGIAPLMMFTALRQYLQGRGITAPGMWVTLAANVVNVAANLLLIYGVVGLGIPALGLVGAGVATTITRFAMFLGLMGWARSQGLFVGAWTPWRRAALGSSGFLEILGFGAPVGLQLALEMWAFQITTLLAGYLGAASLAAHAIVINLASMTFMVPLGVSMAAVTRVGNLLGAGERAAAQRSAWLALGLGGGVMTAGALIFFGLAEVIPRLFSKDAGVVAIAAGLLPIAAAFQLFDGLQVVGGGILRGMGRTRPAALFNLLGYYALGLPLAIWLAFEAGFGAKGLWWGLTVALATVALLLVGWVWRRGPARATTVARPTGGAP